MRHLWCQELIDTNDPLHARHADAQTYAKEINTLLDDILNISPPKSGSKGQVFKLWGKSTPERCVLLYCCTIVSSIIRSLLLTY